MGGETLMESLTDAFQQYPKLKTYVVDDQGQLRQHMQVFVDGQLIRDRECFTDRVSDQSEIFIMQALSGGV